MIWSAVALMHVELAMYEALMCDEVMEEAKRPHYGWQHHEVV